MAYPKPDIEASKDRINRHHSLNAVVRTRYDAARRESELNQGLLSGKTILVKDNLSIKGEPLTCGSHVLDGYRAPYHATVVERIIQAGGAIIGHTNMDEFAMGSSNEYSVFGPVKNPHDPTRVPGGSSGGSAAAVSAGLSDLALGSDTGGSIRQPASFCGVYGLKPTYGRVSRFGLAAFGSSFDQIGPLALSLEDLGTLFSVISGGDIQDNTVSHKPVPTVEDCFKKPLPKTIGIPRAWLKNGVDSSILKRVSQLESFCRTKGISILDIELPHAEVVIPCYYILTMAEASSNLARYDGIHYGHRKNENNIEDLVRESRERGFGEEVKRRLMLGNYILSAGYYDQYYSKAQKVRRLIKEGFQKVFESVDLIVSPVAPTTAFNIGEKSEDPIQMYLSDMFTIPMSLAGVPALSIPAGKDSANCPIGLQLTGNNFDEETILSFARRLESDEVFH